MSKQEDRFVQSVIRAVDILRCFEDDESLGLTEISRKIGLHKSTTFGLVSTLVHASLLEKNQKSEKYQLGLGLFSLGTLVKHDLRSVVEPFLIQLVEQSKETVNFVVRNGDSVMYISKIESPHSMRICTQIGRHLPLYCTAVGKAILAFLDESEVRSILEARPLEEFTGKTMTDAEEIIKTLPCIRAQGYAVDDEELEYGLTCVAAPIFNSQGKPIAGLSVSGPTSRMDQALLDKCSILLRNYTSQISDKMKRR